MRLPNGTSVFIPRFHKTGTIIGSVHTHHHPLAKKYRVRLSDDRIIRLRESEFQRLEAKKTDLSPDKAPDS